MTTMHQPEWRLIGQSVRGASHKRSGLPNQDAITCRPESGIGPPLIVALSDGHGSSKSFRSHLGSAFAVESVAQLLQELVDTLEPDPKSLSAVKRTAEERLPQELVRRWRSAVDSHLQEHPFSEEELARLTLDRGEPACRQLEAHPHLAYGATLLAVLATGDFLLFLQLGDGDILLVTETGEVTHALSRDPRLMGNETTSLCMERAWREVRLRFHVCHGDLPALIVLATDGYANSFVNEAAFFKVGSDLLEILRAEGVTFVGDNLPSWLDEASADGSGDDITLGILYRSNALSSPLVSAASTETELEPESALLPECAQVAEEADSVGDVPAPIADPPVSGDALARQELTRKVIERIKHDGPREQTKQGRIADILEDGPSERRSAARGAAESPESPCGPAPDAECTGSGEGS
jgi:serine/threonine protein phosphatase PrpC